MPETRAVAHLEHKDGFAARLGVRLHLVLRLVDDQVDGDAQVQVRDARDGQLLAGPRQAREHGQGSAHSQCGSRVLADDEQADHKGQEKGYLSCGGALVTESARG